MPTRKSKNKKSNKNNKHNKHNKHNTRKNTPGPLNDPLFQAMKRGNIRWGDLLVDENAARPPSSPVKPKSPTMENIALKNWSMPDLTMRKGIWEHFPVTLVPLDDHDGTERYAIEWHRKHLREWGAAHSASLAQYQAYTEFRLLHALEAHPHKYVVELPRTKDQIAVIAMVHAGPRVAHSEPKAEPHVAPHAAVGAPVLRKLNDIKEHFPVVWHAVPGHHGKSTYALELFGKKLREMSTAAGRNVSNEVTAHLMTALHASSAWHVLPSKGKELCRLEMA